MIKKSDIRDALKAHRDAVDKMKQGLLENSGDKVSTHLEAANCAWGLVEELLAKKYPEHIVLGEEEEIDEEEEEEVEVEENDDLEEEEDDE